MRVDEFDLQLIFDAGSDVNGCSIKKNQILRIRCRKSIQLVRMRFAKLRFLFPSSPSSLRHSMMSLMDDIT